MPYNCKVCENKPFSTQSTLNRHTREVHNMKTEAVYDKNVWSHRCLEENCDSSFYNSKCLISHLESQHNLKFETEIVEMDTLSDFYKWKGEIEMNYKCQYIRKSTCKRPTMVTIYFTCNRTKSSYKLKEDTERKRSQKKQGSCKLDNSCTSQIKVIKTHEGVKVEWQKYHYGHDLDIKHLRLPKHERHNIFSKIISGYTPQMILEALRKNASEDDLNRINLLTPKDIRNIKNSYKKIELDNVGPGELKHILASKNISIKDKDLKTILFPKTLINCSEYDHTYANGAVCEVESQEEKPFNKMQQEYYAKKTKLDYESFDLENNECENEEEEIYEEDLEDIECENEEEIYEEYLENDIECENEEEEIYEEDLKNNIECKNEEEKFSEEDLIHYDEEITLVLENSEEEEQEEIESSIRGNSPKSFVDYVESDLENPAKRHKFWIESQKTVENYRNENIALINRSKLMESTIAKLSDLVTELKSRKRKK